MDIIGLPYRSGNKLYAKFTKDSIDLENFYIRTNTSVDGTYEYIWVSAELEKYFNPAIEMRSRRSTI